MNIQLTTRVLAVTAACISASSAISIIPTNSSVAPLTTIQDKGPVYGFSGKLNFAAESKITFVEAWRADMFFQPGTSVTVSLRPALGDGSTLYSQRWQISDLSYADAWQGPRSLAWDVVAGDYLVNFSATGGPIRDLPSRSLGGTYVEPKAMNLVSSLNVQVGYTSNAIAPTASVPDAGSTLALFGVAVGGLGICRRKFAKR